MPKLNFAKAFKNYMNCAHWMLSNPKMPNCADTSSTRPLLQERGYYFLLYQISHFPVKENLSNYSSRPVFTARHLADDGRDASLFNTIKSTPQIQTMRTYQNLGSSAAFLSAVFFADTFFVSTISIADFGHADFGHSPVQQ